VAVDLSASSRGTARWVRGVEGIWTAIDCGLGGFRLRTDDGGTHIYAAAQVHCQVLEAWVTPEGAEVGRRATPSG